LLKKTIKRAEYTVSGSVAIPKNNNIHRSIE